MRRFQKLKSSGIKLLIAVLAITCFTRGVLQYLIEGKDLSLYGLSNAVTRFSQDVESYDRATDLEGIGYKILTMPKKQWNRINSMVA